MLMDRPPDNTRPYARFEDALLRAARMTRTMQGELGNKGSWRKKDHTPVTLADLASQALLLGALAEDAPEDQILAEEETASLKKEGRAGAVRELVEEALERSVSIDELHERIGYRGNPEAQAHWLVDPIDGTKGYVRGLAYAIAAARIDGDQLERSWMAVPCADHILPRVSGHIFSAVRGKGASKLSIETGETTPLPASQSDLPLEGGRLTIVASRAHETVDLPPTVDEERWPVDLLSLDSQAKYAALASGEAHLYPRKESRWIGKFFCWDHAPGVLLVQETGGVCTDLAGMPLDWSPGLRMENNRGIFAATHPELHERFQPLFAAHGLRPRV